MSSTSLNPWLLRLIPLVFLSLWSAGFAVSKVGLAYAPPFTLLAMRYALAFSVLLVAFLILRPPLPRTRREWANLAVVGFLIQGVYFGMSYGALVLGASANVVAMVASLQPILVALGAPLLVGERVAPLQWLGLALGLLGAIGVILARASVAVESVPGICLAVGALLGMTSAVLYEKRLGVAQHPVTNNLVQYSVGLVCCAPLALLFEHSPVHWAPAFIGALAYLVLANSLLAISLLVWMIRAGEAARVSALFFCVPPGAALSAWLLLGETLPPLAWVAMVIAIGGVLLATRAGGKAAR